MSTRDITDAQVCQAYADAQASAFERWPYDLLSERTGECRKVCVKAMERAERRGFVECGVSLRTGWLTPAGVALAGGGA